jgi:type VI secretion system secreted protein Hcp
MAVDMFLKLEGVQGESTSDKHKGEIEIMSFSWGMNQSTAQAGGAGAGKVSVQDFSFVKQLDTASPQLIELACRGQHVGEALLTLTKTGSKEQQQEYLKIKLTDILISSYQTGGTNSSIPSEQVSFNYSSIEVQAAELRPDGSIGGWKATGDCHFGGKR